MLGLQMLSLTPDSNISTAAHRSTAPRTRRRIIVGALVYCGLLQRRPLFPGNDHEGNDRTSWAIMKMSAAERAAASAGSADTEAASGHWVADVALIVEPTQRVRTQQFHAVADIAAVESSAARTAGRSRVFTS